ncbi:hypothetical protein [Conyzicola sp.]|uniref:hypothetical protein n=1 Tax=Conyzicola sp. TaxID=1969404 RepID=UPI00398947D8
MARRGVIAAGVAVLGVVAVVGGMLVLSSGGGVTTRSGGGGCGTGIVDPAIVAASDVRVDDFEGEQLVNAAQVMNAATAAGLPQRAQFIGVMTAIGESSLRNLTYGDDILGVTNPDGSLTSSIGLFQQQSWWGSRAIRLDPYRSALLFYERLGGVAGWEALPPTAAAHAVQRNADPDHYTRFFEPAVRIVEALTAAAGGSDCPISVSARLLAQELVVHADDGSLRGLVPDHLRQIRWIANGDRVPGCAVDTRILQIMVIAVRYFDEVGVSSINRNCTAELLGAGAESWHYRNGGGRAVDFFSLNGVALTGADAQSLRLIGLLDPSMPEGSRVGQSQCRAEIGIRLALSRWTDIADGCNHLHIDVGGTSAPLLVR